MVARKTPQLLAPGAQAPGFTLPALDGPRRSLSELLAGGPVVLAFFKTTCPVCQFTFPYLERLSASVPVVGISQDSVRDTRDFMNEFGCTFPVLLDPEGSYPVSNAYGISHVPSVFLVGADGRIEQAFDGWSRQDMESLAAVRNAPALFMPGEQVPAFRPG
jgi:peroxiredoxin